MLSHKRSAQMQILQRATRTVDVPKESAATRIEVLFRKVLVKTYEVC